MSDTFWLGVFGLLTLIVKDWLDGRRVKRTDDKIDLNTQVTTDAKREVFDKVDSATKEVKEQATGVATIAKRAVTEAKESATATQQATETLIGATEHIKGSLNGHLEEKFAQVNDHANRIAALENGVEEIRGNVQQILTAVNHDNHRGTP